MDDSIYEKSKAEKVFGVIKKIVQYFFIFLVIGIYALLCFRMCTKGDPSAMKEYTWTERSIAAYNASPDTFAVKELEAINTTDLDNKFYIRNVRYTECIGQFQFTLRFNRSVLRELEDKYGEDTVYDMPFIFTVSDDKGKIYTSYSYMTGKRFVNRFYRIEFSDIDLENVEWLKVNVYYANAEAHGTEICNTLTLYENGRRFFDYRLESEMFTGNVPPRKLTPGVEVDASIYASPTVPGSDETTAETDTIASAE